MSYHRKDVKTDIHAYDLDIVPALIDVAGQECNDGNEYDLMQEAAEYIKELREKLCAVENKFNMFDAAITAELNK